VWERRSPPGLNYKRPVSHNIETGFFAFIAAAFWGMLDRLYRLRGTPLNTADGMIAATAMEHVLTVVTRNVKDFSGLGADVLNPWDPA
jgi:predicted nucleic acid-binding protein